MRFLFVSRFFAPDSLGGYELNCQRHARELVRRGHSVTVLSRPLAHASSHRDAGDLGGNGATAANDGVHVLRRLPDVTACAHDASALRKRAYQLQLSRANQSAGRRMRQVLEEIRPDLVVFWGMNMLILSPILAVRAARVPYAFDIGDYWLLDGLKYFGATDWARRAYHRLLLGGSFEPRLIRNAVVHSHYMQERLVAAGIADDAVHVIPRPLSENFAAPEAVAKTDARRADTPALRLLYVGRLVPDKGVHVAVEALRRLGETSGRRVEFSIYGDGFPDYVAALKEQVKTVGGRCRALLLGHTRPERMQAVYRHHDALLFPVLWDEPSSNVLVEATAAGMPVISTRSGSVAEFLVGGHNGLLIDKGDVEGLMRAIDDLDADLARYVTQAQALAPRVRERHAPQPIFERTERFLASILSQATGG